MNLNIKITDLTLIKNIMMFKNHNFKENIVVFFYDKN